MSYQDPLYEPKFNSPSQAPPAAARSGPPQYLLNNVEQSVSTTSTVKTSNKGSRLAVGGLVAAMAVGGAFAARTAMTGPAGPSNSDEAVTQVFQALDDDDFVGVAELIHPAERESLAQPIFEMIDNYARLEIIASSVDTSSSSFTDIEVDGLTYSVEATGPRLHWVTTTGGTITSNANFEPPVGSLMDRLGIETPAVEPELVTEDLAADPVSFAVVEVDGSWYVSLWYTVAETARRDADMAFPGLGNGPVPVGAETPDAVMEDMVRRMVEFDGEGLMTLLDPQEAAALYDYSPLFLDDMRTALAEVKTMLDDEGVEWTLDSVDFEANEQNGRQIVSFKSMAMTFDFQGETGTIAFKDGCMTADFQGEFIDSCDADNEYGELSSGVTDELKELLDFSEESLAAFRKLDAVDVGLTVVERDGRWYLSAMPTVLGTVNDHLAVVDSDDLFAMYTDFEELGEDPDRLLNGLNDLSGGMVPDLDSMLGLGDPAQVRFESVADEIGSSPSADDGDWEVTVNEDPDLYADSEIEGLLPGYFFFDTPADRTNLSAAGDLSDAPAVVAAKFLYGEDLGSIEVVQFERPVNPAVLTVRGWSLQELRGVTYATNDGWSSSYAFVNEFVIWAGNDAESVDMLMAQVDLLR